MAIPRRLSVEPHPNGSRPQTESLSSGGASWWTSGRQLLALLTYIGLLHVVGVAVFTRGFLLTRVELPFRSECGDLRGSGAGTVFDVGGRHGRPPCWTAPAFNKTVWLVLDALRFDFVASAEANGTHYLGRMPKLRARLEEGAGRGAAALFKFVADPPTTTQQRLKGLITGGLPTFIDVGSSFNAEASVSEDNLVTQLTAAGVRLSHMGDDAWIVLFGAPAFARAAPFPSFNVFDLHGLDDNVIALLGPELAPPLTATWDVLIAHVLGVDHVGHVHGSESAAMASTLTRYDTLVDDTLAAMQAGAGPGGPYERSLLIVMGDHSQTLQGDHGGGTPDETETALFAYALGPPPAADPYAGWLAGYTRALYINAWQVDRYLSAYAEASGAPLHAQGSVPLATQWARARALLPAPPPGSFAPGDAPWPWPVDGRGSGPADIAALESLRAALDMYLAHAASAARARWTQFDVPAMAVGACLMALTVGLQATTLHKLSTPGGAAGGCLPAARAKSILRGAGFGVVLAATWLAIAAGLRGETVGVAVIAWAAPPKYWMVLAATAGASLLAYLCDLWWWGRPRVMPPPPVGPSARSIVAGMTTAAHSAAMVSLGCLKQEVSVLHALTIVPVAVVALWHHGRRPHVAAAPTWWRTASADLSLIAVGIIGIPLSMGVQAKAMDPPPVGQHHHWGPLLRSAVSTAALTAGWVAHTHLGTGGGARGARATLLAVAALSAAARWWAAAIGAAIADATPDWAASLNAASRGPLPWACYSASGCLLALELACLMRGERRRGMPAGGPGGSAGAVARAAVRLPMAFAAPLVMLLGPSSPVVLLCACAQAHLTLAAGMDEDDPPAPSSTPTPVPTGRLSGGSVGGASPPGSPSPVAPTAQHQLLAPSGGVWWRAAAWHRLAVLYFLATGHQCMFGALHFTSSFIGFEAFNFFVQGTLLALNTFGPQLLFGLAVPLIALRGLPSTTAPGARPSAAFEASLARASLGYGLARSAPALVVFLTVAWERRHLEVWAVFAPKFVFEAIALLVGDCVAVAAAAAALAAWQGAGSRSGGRISGSMKIKPI